jgi:hypothetical protein
MAQYGFSVEREYSSINIEENESTKPLIALFDKWGAQKFVGTEYEKSDYEKSSLFVLVGFWENGYPQPEDPEKFMKLTYDLSDYCDECGVGAVQNSEFRIKKEPVWKSKMIFELQWVYDEFFVRKDIYESFFQKKYNIKHWNVRIYKGDLISPSVCQLILPQVKARLKLNDHPFEICEKCKRRKYSPQIKGFFPGFEKNVSEYEIFKSVECFGTGGNSHNKTFITRNVWDELKLLGLRPRVLPVDPDYK